jgi:hypothetical protein
VGGRGFVSGIRPAAYPEVFPRHDLDQLCPRWVSTLGDGQALALVVMRQNEVK